MDKSNELARKKSVAYFKHPYGKKMIVMSSSPSGHHIIVVGGSAGGIQALKMMLGHLPKGLAASFFIVLHSHERAPRNWAKFFSNECELPISFATHNQRIESGNIYLAPPDQHLLLSKDCVLLSSGPYENRCRPAIDPLFRSAAVTYGTHVVGVVLTGLLDDGSEGLNAVKRCGGFTMVQDPEDAAYPDMPRAALDRTEVDVVGTPQQLAQQLCRLTTVPPDCHPIKIPVDLQVEAKMSERVMSNMDMMTEFGEPVPISCPSCAGPLWERRNAVGDRYRCHMGHAFSARTLLIDQDEAVEKALWSAVRTLEERSRMLQRLANRAKATDRHTASSLFSNRARKATEEAQHIHAVIRDVIQGHAQYDSLTSRSDLIDG